MPTWNFALNIISPLSGDRRGLVALGADGSRREWTFAEIDHISSRFAGGLRERGVQKGDVVLTRMGNTAEWVFTLTACWRIGAVAMPCNVQLTQADLTKRVELVRPKLEIVSGLELADGDPAPAEPLEYDDPALIIFTSGTAGE